MPYTKEQITNSLENLLNEINRERNWWGKNRVRISQLFPTDENDERMYSKNYYWWIDRASWNNVINKQVIIEYVGAIDKFVCFAPILTKAKTLKEVREDIKNYFCDSVDKIKYMYV
ncbi:hypothetical protein HYT51_00455 [Candidatus Woesearchaeota archaeon]|nr:hypothetical protein [Candidatus Woesearchaeota archaeon]